MLKCEISKENGFHYHLFELVDVVLQPKYYRQLDQYLRERHYELLSEIYDLVMIFKTTPSKITENMKRDFSDNLLRFSKIIDNWVEKQKRIRGYV